MDRRAVINDVASLVQKFRRSMRTLDNVGNRLVIGLNEQDDVCELVRRTRVRCTQAGRTVRWHQLWFRMRRLLEEWTWQTHPVDLTWAADHMTAKAMRWADDIDVVTFDIQLGVARALVLDEALATVDPRVVRTDFIALARRVHQNPAIDLVPEVSHTDHYRYLDAALLDSRCDVADVTTNRIAVTLAEAAAEAIRNDADPEVYLHLAYTRLWEAIALADEHYVRAYTNDDRPSTP